MLDTCARCGKSLANKKVEGIPTCSGCAKKLDIQHRISKEEKRYCPVDKSEMKKLNVGNVIIDKCSKCHGIWLDEDELKILKKHSGDIDWVKGFLVGSL